MDALLRQELLPVFHDLVEICEVVQEQPFEWDVVTLGPVLFRVTVVALSLFEKFPRFDNRREHCDELDNPPVSEVTEPFEIRQRITVERDVDFLTRFLDFFLRFQPLDEHHVSVRLPKEDVSAHEHVWVESCSDQPVLGRW